MSTATAPALAPAHLDYLRARGITDATIAANNLHSARPQDLARLAGRPVPDGHSGLLIPYEGCDGFARVRLFPLIASADGKEQKFGQPLGSGVRAYVPAGVREVLPHPERAIGIIEGEVKGLALTQVGFATVAIGGIWNFRTKDLPRDGIIPDLESVAWRDRAVYLMPDSDAWEKEQVLLAVFRLARALEARGAAEAARGKDPAAAWRRLMEKAVTLGHPAFKPFREAEKAKARATEKPGPLPAELEGRRIHPALHFEGDFASVGVLEAGPEGLTWFISTSKRTMHPAPAIETVLTGKPVMFRDVAARWPEANRAAFLAGTDRRPTFAEAVALALDRVRTLLDIGDGLAAVLATWAVATYFHPLFRAFPRLDLRGEKGSGKSKALEILAAIAFNGGVYANPTAAVLHRIADPLRPSLCLDEIEHLDGEEKQAILAFLNMGYKRAGRVPRCEGDEHTLRSFAAYCPVALAGIRGLNDVTEDRAITLTLTRGADREKINAEVDETDPRFAEARAVCYRLALTRWREVAQARRDLALPDWLVGRERELWGPLLTIAHLAEADAGEDLELTADLLALAKVQGEEREGLSDEGEAVVSILTARLAVADTMTVQPADLCDELTKALHRDRPIKPETVGRLLKRLGFKRLPRRAGGQPYEVTAARIAILRERYGGVGGENLH